MVVSQWDRESIAPLVRYKANMDMRSHYGHLRASAPTPSAIVPREGSSE
jgi:hypothetical protein